MSPQQKMILEKLGVEEIISPEEHFGGMVAKMLLNPKMRAYLPLPDNHEIIEISVPRKVVGRSVDDVDFDEMYGLSLIALKRKYEEFKNGQKRWVEHLIKRPKHDSMLEQQDQLLLLGKSTDIKNFIDLNR